MDRTRRRPISPWVAVILLFVGLFGATVAVSGLWAPLPLPKAGGTCGPGVASEAAIAAMVNPGSIGAGAEPPVTRAAARANWKQFVVDCQGAANRRGLVTIPVLVVSLILAVAGVVLLWRRFAPPDRPAARPVEGWPLDHDSRPGPPPPYAARYPGAPAPGGPASSSSIF